MDKIYEKIKKEILNDKKIYILYDRSSKELKNELLVKALNDVKEIKEYSKVALLSEDKSLSEKIKGKNIHNLGIFEETYKMINENGYDFHYYIFDNIRDHFSTIIYALNNREGILTIELEDDKPGDSQLEKMHDLIKNDLGESKYNIIIQDQQLSVFLLKNNELL